MATKVFISWSGDLSRKLAQAIHEWLPGALQYVKPYFSPEDIEKGAKWDTDITNELKDSNIGLICLTKDNLEAPWILFEAGALSKSIEKSRVCTVLFGLEQTDLTGPLATFQWTKFKKDEFRKLFSAINKAAAEETKLSESVLGDVFEMWWPKLEENIKKIIGSHAANSTTETRTEKDMIEEILSLTRMIGSRHGHRSTKVSPDLMRRIATLLYLNERSIHIAQIKGEEPGIKVIQQASELNMLLSGLYFEMGFGDIWKSTWPEKRQSLLDFTEHTDSENDACHDDDEGFAA